MVDVAGAVHVPQHGRVGVLDRHVEVGQQRVVLGHDVDHAQGQRAGVDVEQAQPGEIGHTLHDLREKTRQTMLDAEVGPVADRVLGDEHDLLRPLPDEIDDLLQHVQRTLADLPPLDAGDGAEGAGVVAAVGDLDVGRGAGLGPAEGGQHPLAAGDLRLRRLAQQTTDDVADAMPLPRRQDMVDAARDVVAVVAEGRHAAGGDDDLIVRRRSSSSEMAATDSSRAAPRKPQVLTITTRASSGRCEAVMPRERRR